MFGNSMAGGAARGYADGLVESLDSANETITKANRIIADKNAEIARLNRLLAVEQANNTANIATTRSALEAIQEIAPGHDLLKNSGSTFKSGPRKGKPKSTIRRIWESAFDSAAKERGIPNPTEERED